MMDEDRAKKLMGVLGIEVKKFDGTRIVGDNFHSEAIVDTWLLDQGEDLDECICAVRGRGIGKYQYWFLRDSQYVNRVKRKVEELAKHNNYAVCNTLLPDGQRLIEFKALFRNESYRKIMKTFSDDVEHILYEEALLFLAEK